MVSEEEIVTRLWEPIGILAGTAGEGLTYVDILILLVFLYIMYLIFSFISLFTYFKFAGAETEKMTFGGILSSIVIRDLVFAALYIIPFGLGSGIAFMLWIALLKYRHHMEWGRAILVASLGIFIPLGIAVLVIVISIPLILILLAP